MKHNLFSTGIILGLATVMFFSNCKDPYDPEIRKSNSHFLVVEGFINGNGLTTIRLSRTRNISWGDTATVQYELNAKVAVEDKNNISYPLFEKGEGEYEANTVLNPDEYYRIHIRTADNKEYLSSFVPYKQAPPIDKIGWKFDRDNVQVYVNTHDPQNNTWYYRWAYDETWEFHSDYYSTMKYNPADTTVIDRSQLVYVCWRHQNSTNILLGSSTKLKEDVINEAPIVLIPFSDRRISVLYSILVTQYALDSSAYNYWSAMKSNTENVGSIFDPQPNQTRGNIYCTTDTTETVIGYVSAGSTQQARLFISNSSMPAGWNQKRFCTEYEVPNIKDSLEYFFNPSTGGFIPYLKDLNSSGGIKGYFSASASCVDCTLTGTPVKPSFWP